MTDQKLALKMLDVIENLYLENMLLKLVLHDQGWTAMDKVLREAHADNEVKSRVRQQFAPVRQKVQQSDDLEAAIQEFLRVVPPSLKLN